MIKHQNVEYKQSLHDDHIKGHCYFGTSAVGGNAYCNGIRKGGQIGGQAGGQAGGQVI